MTGGHTGKDDLAGITAEDTGISSVFVGPEFTLTRQEPLNVEIGCDFSIHEDNSALQLVPDYRIRAALTWRF